MSTSTTLPFTVDRFGFMDRSGANNRKKVSRRSGRAQGAQACVPPWTSAQVVPAQQVPAVGSQGSPLLTQLSSPGGSEIATQTVPPATPTQAPLQQSSGAPQPAPSRAQLSRH